jgi:hypothetical protein
MWKLGEAKDEILAGFGAERMRRLDENEQNQDLTQGRRER